MGQWVVRRVVWVVGLVLVLAMLPPSFPNAAAHALPRSRRRRADPLRDQSHPLRARPPRRVAQQIHPPALVSPRSRRWRRSWRPGRWTATASGGEHDGSGISCYWRWNAPRDTGTTSRSRRDSIAYPRTSAKAETSGEATNRPRTGTTPRCVARAPDGDATGEGEGRRRWGSRCARCCTEISEGWTDCFACAARAEPNEPRRSSCRNSSGPSRSSASGDARVRRRDGGSGPGRGGVGSAVVGGAAANGARIRVSADGGRDTPPLAPGGRDTPRGAPVAASGRLDSPGGRVARRRRGRSRDASSGERGASFVGSNGAVSQRRRRAGDVSLRRDQGVARGGIVAAGDLGGVRRVHRRGVHFTCFLGRAPSIDSTGPVQSARRALVPAHLEDGDSLRAAQRVDVREGFSRRRRRRISAAITFAGVSHQQARCRFKSRWGGRPGSC